MSPRFKKDDFVQNLARGQLLVPYLERYDKLDKEWTFTYKPKGIDDAWHPSGDCIPSPTALYTKALHAADTEPVPHSPGTQRNFMVGHFFHAVVQDMLVDMEFATPDAIERRGSREWGMPRFADCTMGCVGGHSENCEAWRPVGPQPYHWATGSGDVVPMTLPGGWTGVMDIKTMAGVMYKQAWKSGLLPPAFADKYECQVNIYMDFFDQDKALILGINKDAPHGFAEFEFERNQDLIDTIYAKWEYVSHCLHVGVEPDADAWESFILPLTGPIS